MFLRECFASIKDTFISFTIEPFIPEFGVPSKSFKKNNIVPTVSLKRRFSFI